MSAQPKSAGVREPIQVYLDTDERRLLDQTAAETGLSRAEILRQGLRRFAAEVTGSAGPVHAFMTSLRRKPLPAELARAHDDYLARAYTDTNRK